MVEVSALAQNSETATELLHSGHGQLAAARALLLDLDPRVRPAAARDNLLAAWSSLAPLFGCASVSELAQRLAGERVAGSDALPGLGELAPAERLRTREVLAALLEANGAAATLRAGGRALGRDALLEHVRVLGRVYSAVDRERTGGAFARARTRRNWGALVLLAIAALVAGALVVATRAPADEGRWRASLYRSKVFSGEPAARRRDRDINFDWGLDSPLGDAMPVDFFSVRWDTCMVLERAVAIEFLLVSDDGARVFVDGDRVVNNWGSHRARQARGARVLDPGVHHVQVLYYDQRGPAQVHLTATVDGGAIGPLPPALLWDPGASFDPEDPCARVRAARSGAPPSPAPSRARATEPAAAGASSTPAPSSTPSSAPSSTPSSTRASTRPGSAGAARDNRQRQP